MYFPLGVFVITIDVLLDVLEDDLFSMDVGALTTVGFIFTIIVILVIALATQPSDQKKLSFRVRFICYCNIWKQVIYW